MSIPKITTARNVSPGTLTALQNDNAISRAKKGLWASINPLLVLILLALYGCTPKNGDISSKPESTGKEKEVSDPLHKVWKLDDVALVVIDYQPEMYDQIRSETPASMIDLNTRYMIRAAKAFNIPVVLSEVGVEMGANRPTVKSITDELPGVKPIDRSSMNSWDDPKFIAAIKATGRHRLVFCGLYTEICLAYPVIDALGDGYDVAFIVDAVGGMTQLAHQTGVDRMTRAGAVPSTAMAMICEWFRDWNGPHAEKAKEVVGWYYQELSKISAKK